MKEREIHELIEQQDPEAKKRIYDKIMQKVDFSQITPTPQQPVKTKSRRPLMITLSAIMACLVVLAIVLPITLRDVGGGDRYCDDSQYDVVQVEQTLKQYSSQHNGNLLYVDWYDGADEVLTFFAYSVEDKDDIIFFHESIVNGETGDAVELYVTDTKTKVDILSDYQYCDEELTVTNVAVMCKNADGFKTLAKFTYGNYVYYLSLDVSNGNEQIAEIVENMLQK